MAYDNNNAKSANRDPITGEPGAHPVGTGLGAATGAAAGVAGAVAIGAAAGSVVGPLGAAAGAAIGGIVGGLAGSDIAEDINPTREDAYWSENYKDRDYVDQGTSYETYQPAYRYGVDAYSSNRGKRFDEIEPSLKNNWNSARGSSTLDWEKARHATRDAYDRLYAPTSEDDI